MKLMTIHIRVRVAIVICPIENIIRLNNAGPNHTLNRTFWILREGCLVAPQSIKNDIAYDVMKKVRERMAKEQLVQSTSIMSYELKMVLDILVDAQATTLLLEFISLLLNAVKRPTTQ